MEQPTPAEMAPTPSETEVATAATEEARPELAAATEAEVVAEAVSETVPVTEALVAEAIEEPVADAAATAGITEDGRACNDPRVEPSPVGVVEITTTHPVLFSEYVAPAALSSGRIAPRASNDPRGPLPEQPPMAEAVEG